MVIYPCNMQSVIPIKIKPNLLNLPHGHTGLNPIIRCDPTIKEAEKTTVDIIRLDVILIAQIIVICDMGLPFEEDPLPFGLWIGIGLLISG